MKYIYVGGKSVAFQMCYNRRIVTRVYKNLRDRADRQFFYECKKFGQILFREFVDPLKMQKDNDYDGFGALCLYCYERTITYLIL